MFGTEMKVPAWAPRAREVRDVVRKSPAYRQLRRRAVRARKQMTEVLEDQARLARRAGRRGLAKAEHQLDEAATLVRRAPLRSVGVTFAVGAFVGALAAVLLVPRRR